MKVSELFERYDTSPKNREQYDDLAEWKKAVRQAGADFSKTSITKLTATGWDGICGEYDTGADEGWLVEKWAKNLKEDWGSSDWYPVMRAMEQYMMDGYSMEEAAEMCADRWYQDMGWDEPEQAEMNILARFKRLQQNPPKHAPKPTDNPAYGKVNEGMYVVKNKDGKEKRFKDDSSPEAKAWKDSSSKKSNVKLAVYSKPYWERKEDAGVELLPWTKLQGDMKAMDQIDKIVEDMFGGKDVQTDWTVAGKATELERDGVPCATIRIRVSYEYGKDSDLGNDGPVSDSQYITVGRNPKDPKTIDFINFAS